MIPFRVEFEPGKPPYRQVVFAAHRAIVGGDLNPGDPFPSVRELSRSLKINPNTAHKAIRELVADGLLEMRTGVGAYVAEAPPATGAERAALLTNELQRLVVEAQRLGLGVEEVTGALVDRWNEVRAGNKSKAKARQR